MSAEDDGSTAQGTMTRGEIVDRRIDILSAVILSLATVLAAVQSRETLRVRRARIEAVALLDARVDDARIRTMKADADPAPFADRQTVRSR